MPVLFTSVRKRFSFASADDDAAAGVDDRPARPLDRRRHLVDLFRPCRRAAISTL
jgi:hypothetical protein